MAEGLVISLQLGLYERISYADLTRSKDMHIKESKQ